MQFHIALDLCDDTYTDVDDGAPLPAAAFLDAAAADPDFWELLPSTGATTPFVEPSWQVIDDVDQAALLDDEVPTWSYTVTYIGGGS
jgi:hypothetical protein